jgi:hypothetical protein
MFCQVTVNDSHVCSRSNCSCLSFGFEWVCSETFSKMKNSPNMYYVTVIEDTNTGAVIGSATLLLEQKFIHNCAKVELYCF